MLFVIAILLAVDLYLGWSLFSATSAALRWVGIVLLQVIFASQFWLFFVFFRAKSDAHLPLEKPLRKLAYLSMGAMSFLLVLTLIRDLIYLFMPESLWLRGDLGTTAVLGISLLLMVWGAWRARFHLLSPRVEVSFDHLPPNSKLQGLRIVQLSDVHLGTGPDLEQVKKMVDRALSLQPDLIALTGDIIDGDLKDIQPELGELARLRARYGVFFVLGNHECYWDAPGSIRALEARGIRALQNETLILPELPELSITGLNDPAFAHFGGKGPETPPAPTETELNLILVHQPQVAKKILERASPSRYHLQLSGHTHGGQFWPWSWVVRWMYPVHRGLGELGGMKIYVNTGSGFWGPPIRLGTDGEVTELIVTGRS